MSSSGSMKVVMRVAVALNVLAIAHLSDARIVPRHRQRQMPSFIAVAIENRATTTPDLTGIVTGFQQMQTQIDTLTNEVQEVQAGITEVENEAKATGAGIEQAEKDMALTSEKAAANTATADLLRAQGVKAAAKVEEATRRVAKLKNVLNNLEGTAVEMGAQSTAVGQKVSALDAEAQELLPGVGDVTARIEKAQKTIKEYEAKADSSLDEEIAASLRGHFARSTAIVKQLGEEVAEEAQAQDGSVAAEARDPKSFVLPGR